MPNTICVFLATHPRFPQSSDQLRCPTIELPLDHIRYLTTGEKEFGYIGPEW